MTDAVGRLKELLFDSETRRLSEVQQRLELLAQADERRQIEMTARQTEIAHRVDAVFERAGTEDRLLKSVATVLDGALREAEVTRHEPLSQAMAPLVVKTLKYELKNSQAEMVDALYPLTGKIVKQYVRAAMADLMADIDRKLGGAKPSELEARARTMGVSVAELVVSESQELKVDEMFLVRRGSGDLVAHWQRPGDDGVATTGGSGSNRDVLIAGYLSGIISFSEEAFDDTKGSLRALDMDGERIFVRSSPAYLLAARCSGRAPVAVERVIEDAFVEALSEYRDALAEKTPSERIAQLLPSLARSCETGLAAARADLEQRAAQAQRPRGRGRLFAVGALFLLPLLAWFGWSSWQSWQTSRVQNAGDRVIAGLADLKGFPIRAEVEWGGGALTLKGLAPNDEARARLGRLMQETLSATRVRDELGVLPATAAPRIDVPPDMSGDVASLRQGLAATRQQLADANQKLAEADRRIGDLAAIAQRVPQLQADVETRSRRAEDGLAALQRRVDDIRIPAPGEPSAIERLIAFARQNAVFFANGTDLLDETRTGQTVSALAELMIRTDGLLRVVGYTDERGAPQANQSLAQARAERVVALLVDRGVPRERLVPVGRGTALDISRSTGVGSANRRVEFEIPFAGEPRSP